MSALRRPRRRTVVLLALLVALALLIRPAERHVRAAALLARFADASAEGGLAGMRRYPVDEEPAAVRTSRGEARARVYLPRGVASPPGVVVVHGVHRLAIEEPRLVRFARAIAASGVAVLTPEVREIADYRVDPVSIETIGAAAHTLRERLGTGRAGIMGMSFAGGLSLLAAADPRFADDVGFVVAVGAHHDLARVSRFFATDRIDRPDGTTESLKAHDYGALVFVYARIERFFAPADAPAARDAIRAYLWDQRDDARAKSAALSPEGKQRIEALFAGKVATIAPELMAEIERDRGAMAAVSPRGHLGGIHVPVFLLHGAGDTVIPAAETTWIASEVPPAFLRAALVSPAVVHVELQGKPGLGEQWSLVHFMAQVLDAAADARG